MKEWIQKIAHSELVRNSAKLLTANVVAQAIGLLVYPILTRLYSPEDFGLLNLFLSIGNICLLISTGEYRYAILLPKNEEETISLVKLCFRLVCSTSVLVMLTIPLVPMISELFRVQGLQVVYWMIPIYILVFGIWEALSKWHLRRKEFSILSEFQVVHSSTSAFSKIIFGWCGFTKLGLVFSTLIAPVLSILVYIVRHFKSILPLRSDSRYSVALLLQKYRNFPLLTLPRALTNTLSDSLPALLLTPIFGLSSLGFYTMALIVLRPIQMIVNALYQTLYENIAAKKRNLSTIKSTLLRVFVQLLLYGIIPFVMLMIFAPSIISLLLGEDWIQTGIYIRYLCPWFYCIFLSGAFCFIPELFNKQKLFLAIEILFFLLQIGAMLLGVFFRNIDIAIISMSIVGTLIICLQLVVYYKTIMEYELTIKTLHDGK